MPISRYEIRNEYSLADPELYRAADKDDPEALLEGVAMAGLVGVLRQLGDLAEFASEIFHDLHEEVMATAARGHSLTIRVQQLETEVPSIERAFLSQTDHSPFFYSSGVDLHPNVRMDQNLITQGDLPRFVMDSYEECRGPPRLFLLDKFDVAGAGACLKRYTDPSFFKFEASATSADIQREKKIRKPKKKGPRWRIGETPEVMSHAILHQLFLDEPVENGVNKPARRGKLRRRLNGFPFDPKTGKSYMEKLWRTPSPEHKMLHEITTSSPLQLPSNDHDESDHEVLEVRSVSPARESVGRKRSPPPQDREEVMLKPFMYGANEVSPDDKICKVPNSYFNIVTDDIPSISDELTGEKDITVGGESKAEGSLTGYQSDEIASEIDNYVDAPSTMESEMDTDSELRMKNDLTSYNQRQQLISLENEEHLSQSSDSQSTRDLKLSDECNNSSKKETSSFSSSDSPNTSPEKPQSEEMSAEGFPCADIPGIAIVDASSYQKCADEAFPVNQHPKLVVSANTCTDKDTHTNNRPDSEQMTSSLRGTGPTPNLVHYGSKRVRKSRLWGPNSDETVSTSECEEKKINLIVDSQCSPSVVSDSKSRSGDDSPRCSFKEHPLDEPNGANEPCMSADSDNICHATDSSAATSAHLLHEDGYDWEDIYQFENTSSTLNMPNVLSPDRINTAEMTSTRNPITDKLDGEVLKLPENFPSDDSDDSDIAHNADIITPMISNGEQLNDKLEIEDSNVMSDASPGKELLETSLHNAETVNAEEHYPNGSVDHQISSETLILLPEEGSLDWPEAVVDAYDREAVPEEERAVNGTPELQIPKSCEVVGLQGGEITDDVMPSHFVALESSTQTPENLVDQVGDGIDPYSGDTVLEVTEISSSADLKPLDEVLVRLDESDFQRDQSETEAPASYMLDVPDNAINENVSLPVDLSKLVEEHTLDAIDNDKNSLMASHVDSNLVVNKQSGLVEEDEREAITSDSYTDSCSTINNDIPESEVSHTVPNSHLDSKFVEAPQIQSSLEQSSLDTDQESIQLNSVENLVSGETSLPMNHDTEGKMLQEKIELPPEETNQDRLSLLPTSDQKMLHLEDHKEDNNSPLSFSLVNYPPSESELPGITNYDNDVSEYPKDTLGFVFPPSNPFYETNQMNLDELPPLPPLPPVQWRMGKLQHSSSNSEEETMMHNKELCPQQISLPTVSTEDVSSSLEEMNLSLSQTAPETTFIEEKVGHETIDTPPEIQNKHPQLFIPASKNEVTTPAEEDGVANEGQTKKLPRPRNPLVEDVSVLDKSKLRKVTERFMPQIQKVDERDSILEQIRTKSFNLKPAATSRPSIQGPKTNLNVAAILEKANAIRQAFAGSDDDEEEDNWSDS